LVKKSAKEEVAEAKEAVENATEELTEAIEAIEAEATQPAQPTQPEEKPTKEKPTKNNELAIKVLGVLEILQKNGVTETTSTVLRDKLGTKNRGVIRRVMKGLALQGKVVVSEKKLGKRKRYTYRLA